MPDRFAEPFARALSLGRGPQRPTPDGSVLSLFRVQAERTPAHVAVRFADDTLSYRELSLRVDALAARLVLAGSGPGCLVGLCAARSLELVVAMLAIMQSGAAYVPIDPEAPRARVLDILRQASPQLVLTHRETATVFLDSAVTLLLLDADETLLPGAPVARAQPDDLAYVIFTSGSTGAPKGVEVRHISLANHALSMAELYGLSPGDRVLCSASIGFDVLGEQVYPALVSGAEVVVRPASLFASLQVFSAFLHQAAISVLILPTALFHEWTRELAATRLTLPASVRAVGVGTEQVAAHHLRSFLESAGRPIRFVQGYGPTEATVTCTAYLHDGRAFEAGDVVPIGVPLPNTEAYVLDAQQRPVADDEVGELYVGGVALARGYLGRGDLTRERFVESPFAAHDAGDGRLYRTGDLVRRGADGQLRFVGRADFQIKVRGHRVEPEEVEAVLLEQRGVVEAVVVPRAQGEHTQLVAYVVMDEAPDLPALTAACRERLPSYMVPSTLIPLPALPKTVNQKIDRAALRALAAAAPESPRKDPLTRAHDDDELLVTRAFCEVLGLSAVAPDADFFELGGDSLRALRMLQLLRQSHSAALVLADVFADPTVHGLAVRMRQRGRIDRPSVLCLKAGVGVPLFLVCGIQIYQPLAHALDTVRPVYALLLPSEANVAADSGSVAQALPSVQAFAAEYVALMRSHTPSGPYALGGISFGGAVAYEMAQQLWRAGEEVCLVALFDTVLPRARSRRTFAFLRHKLATLQTLPSWVEQLGRVRERLRTAYHRRRARAAEGGADSAQQAALAVLEQQRERAYGQRMREFDRDLTAYPGRVVLYRALDGEEGSLLPDHGFAAFAPDLTIWDVPGDHLGILREPSVATLAAHLSSQLPSG